MVNCLICIETGMIRELVKEAKRLEKEMYEILDMKAQRLKRIPTKEELTRWMTSLNKLIANKYEIVKDETIKINALLSVIMENLAKEARGKRDAQPKA